MEPICREWKPGPGKLKLLLLQYLPNNFPVWKNNDEMYKSLKLSVKWQMSTDVIYSETVENMIHDTNMEGVSSVN